MLTITQVGLQLDAGIDEVLTASGLTLGEARDAALDAGRDETCWMGVPLVREQDLVRIAEHVQLERG